MDENDHLVQLRLNHLVQLRLWAKWVICDYTNPSVMEYQAAERLEEGDMTPRRLEQVAAGVAGAGTLLLLQWLIGAAQTKYVAALERMYSNDR